MRRQGEDRQGAARAGILGAELAGQPRAHMLGDVARIAREADRLGDAFEDGRQVADRDALVEQLLQHALDAGDGDLARHQVLDQLLLLLGQVLQELLHLGVGQQVGHVGLEDLGQVGRQHGRRIDHGIAADRRLLAQRWPRSRSPAGRRSARSCGGRAAPPARRPGP